MPTVIPILTSFTAKIDLHNCPSCVGTYVAVVLQHWPLYIFTDVLLLTHNSGLKHSISIDLAMTVHVTNVAAEFSSTH